MITWERNVFIVVDAVAQIFQIFFTTCRSLLQSEIRTKSFKGISENIPEEASLFSAPNTNILLYFLSFPPSFLPSFSFFSLHSALGDTWKLCEKFCQHTCAGGLSCFPLYFSFVARPVEFGKFFAFVWCRNFSKMPISWDCSLLLDPRQHFFPLRVNSHPK